MRKMELRMKSNKLAPENKISIKKSVNDFQYCTPHCKSLHLSAMSLAESIVSCLKKPVLITLTCIKCKLKNILRRFYHSILKDFF